MRASDELSAVLHTAAALAARDPEQQVTLAHLADALLRSARGAAPVPQAEPPPEWSSAAGGAVDRAMRIAAREGGLVAERRHLTAALTEIIRFRDMVTGIGPFIDHLPARTPDGGITYTQEATSHVSLTVHLQETGETG